MAINNEGWAEYLPDGWHALYRALIAELERINPKIEVMQAKQKFGELRVYLKKGSPEVNALIDEATNASLKTCEVCGADGELKNIDGFYTTRCPEHAAGGWPTVSPINASYRFIGGKLVSTAVER